MRGFQKKKIVFRSILEWYASGFLCVLLLCIGRTLLFVLTINFLFFCNKQFEILLLHFTVYLCVPHTDKAWRVCTSSIAKLILYLIRIFYFLILYNYIVCTHLCIFFTMVYVPYISFWTLVNANRIKSWYLILPDPPNFFLIVL